MLILSVVINVLKSYSHKSLIGEKSNVFINYKTKDVNNYDKNLMFD